MSRLRLSSRALTRRAWPIIVIGALLALSGGTISNQIRINAANTRLAKQAADGQKALIRTCHLLPVATKIYVDALRRKVITQEDFLLVQSSAQQACPRP